MRCAGVCRVPSFSAGESLIDCRASRPFEHLAAERNHQNHGVALHAEELTYRTQKSGILGYKFTQNGAYRSALEGCGTGDEYVGSN